MILKDQEEGGTPILNGKWTGSIKGDVKRKYFSLSAGRGSCLTSSPVCGSVLERCVAPDPGPSVAAFFVPCRSACKLRGGDVPTMWFYRRLEAYGFVGLSEGAYGGP